MHLEGSCHCGAIQFSLESAHPYPFNLCYCSICRKTTGGGGYAINLGGEHASLKVSGDEHLRIYQAMVDSKDGNGKEQSPGQRHFCGVCGTHLWMWDPRWPELLHPLASAIDTPLPVSPERTHLLVASKADWVPLQADQQDKVFDGYPDESIADWHERLALANPSY